MCVYIYIYLYTYTYIHIHIQRAGFGKACNFHTGCVLVGISVEFLLCVELCITIDLSLSLYIYIYI